MPELPEVETFRRLALRVGDGQEIETTVALEDDIVFQGCEAEEVAAALRGRALKGVGRRGKYLWFQMAQGPRPLFHFGMTGRFISASESNLELVTQPTPSNATAWPPRFTKIHFRFANGGRLAYLNARRFGRIRLLEDPLNEAPVKDLGVDPLLEDLHYPTLETRLQRRRTVKGILLDQKIFAGVGNWIADEALFQSGLDPRRKGEDASPEEWQRLLISLKEIISTAVQVGAVKERFPESWIFHSRWHRQRPGPARRRTDVEFLKVAGRTTAWVPHLQH